MTKISNNAKAFLKRASKQYNALPTYLKLEKGESIEGTLTELDVYKFKQTAGLTNYFKNGDFILKLVLETDTGDKVIMERKAVSGLASKVQEALENGFDIGSTVSISRNNDDNGTYEIDFIPSENVEEEVEEEEEVAEAVEELKTARKPKKAKK